MHSVAGDHVFFALNRAERLRSQRRFYLPFAGKPKFLEAAFRQRCLGVEETDAFGDRFR